MGISCWYRQHNHLLFTSTINHVGGVNLCNVYNLPSSKQTITYLFLIITLSKCSFFLFLSKMCHFNCHQHILKIPKVDLELKAETGSGLHVASSGLIVLGELSALKFVPISRRTTTFREMSLFVFILKVSWEEQYRVQYSTMTGRRRKLASLALSNVLKNKYTFHKTSCLHSLSCLFYKCRNEKWGIVVLGVVIRVHLGT